MPLIVPTSLWFYLSKFGFFNDRSAAVVASDFKLDTIAFEVASPQRADLRLVSCDVGAPFRSLWAKHGARHLQRQWGI
jgi:hypothetical protein